MSLKPLQTHFTGADSLYAPYTGGGGGGGGGGGPVLSTLEFYTSSIGALGGGSVDCPNGLLFPVGANIGIEGAPIATAVGDIDFGNNNGTITGLSTINGKPVTATSSILASAYVGSVAQSLTPSAPFSTSVGAWYQVSVGISDLGFSGLAANDSITITAGSPAGATALTVLDLPRLSTLRGSGAGGGSGSIGLVASGVVESLSSFMDIVAVPNTGSAASTFVSVDYAAWLKQVN